MVVVVGGVISVTQKVPLPSLHSLNTESQRKLVQPKVPINTDHILAQVRSQSVSTS